MKTVSDIAGSAAGVRARPTTARARTAQAAVEAAPAYTLPHEPGGVILLPLALVLPVLILFETPPMAVLALALGLGLISLGFVWEALATILFSVAFFLGPLKMGFGGWIAYASPDLLAALLVLRWLATDVGQGGRFLARHPLLLPFGCLFVYLMLQMVNPQAPFLRSLFGLRSWLLYTVFLFVGFAGYRSPLQVQRLYKVIVLLALVSGVYGILQWQGGPAAVAELGGHYVAYAEILGYQPWETEEGGAVFRAVSTFMSATMFAQNMAYAIVMAFALALWRPTRWWMRVVYLGSIVLLAGAVATTGSRMAPVYITAAVILTGLLFRSARILFVAGPVAAVGLELGRSITQDSMALRFLTLFDEETYFWKWYRQLRGGFFIGVDNPFGKGLGYTAGVPAYLDPELVGSLPAGSTNTIDSGYGMVAAELGVIGLPVFVWFAIMIAIAGYRAWRGLPGHLRALFIPSAVWTIMFPALTILGAPHASLPGSAFIWLLAGMFLRAGQVERAGGAPPS